MGVPVIGQIILESYINKESLRKSENVGQFLNLKLRKLYSLFDSLLNLTNKNYIGLLQDVNSQELAMNYQSINTVFSVTSFSGATLSLHESEQRMKEKANSDFCYFNTYLRKYEMLYETAAGMEKVKVSLRDCIIIVMMDNLVRLKYHKDPEPGESRSMQICTLPITIKGIPKDAKEIEKWHDHTICDGTNTCKCKEDLQLQKTDFENEVLCLNAEEKSVLTRCHQLFRHEYIFDDINILGSMDSESR
ncbi:Hypothetical predicted protein [Mytilus galloprovincialis]|uniref:Uncharacterized protein n=1 Tax=Mytilus galloprovincialis TaxID=29158 RepID=A0A8B6BGQ4_MYTGA|nr:Hypothetical predicted protein [Mytilus galloprovincialis]